MAVIIYHLFWDLRLIFIRVSAYRNGHNRAVSPSAKLYTTVSCLTGTNTDFIAYEHGDHE